MSATGHAVGRCYYRRLGDGAYEPTEHVQGAWSPKEQHMGPVSGLITHAIERHAPRPELALARLSFEILGMIAAEPTSVKVETIRPGRTIELLEATATIAGRPVIRARAWRLSRQDSRAVAGGEPPRMPGPDGIPAWHPREVWGGGYIESLVARRVPGAEPGRARVWLRTDCATVEGEPSTPVTDFVRLVDTANGVATRVPPGQWMFPNTDLTIHLFREPHDASWVGLDSSVTFGSGGIGLTSAVLSDVDGPLGRSEQILTVRPLRP